MRAIASCISLWATLMLAMPVHATGPSLRTIVSQIRPGDATEGYSTDNPKRAFAAAKLRQKDYAAATDALLDLARRGDTWAMREIGWLYAEGTAFPANQERSLGWFFEAALAGDERSMLLLGTAFSRGLGVDRDPILAKFWLERARDSGDRMVAGPAADEIRSLGP